MFSSLSPTFSVYAKGNEIQNQIITTGTDSGPSHPSQNELILPKSIDPQLEPTTNWIAYIGLDYNVWLIQPDGSQEHQITTDADPYSSLYKELNWSPDGKKLAFVKDYWKLWKKDIFVYDVSQNNIKRIIDIDQTAGGFDWYQDSDHIIFDRPSTPIEKSGVGYSCTVGYKNNDGLFIVTLSTGEMKPFLHLPGELPIRNPNVSPDNKSIIFDFLQPNEQYLDQFIMPVDNPSAFKEISSVQSDCDWNPDGTQIACGTWDGVVDYSDDAQPRPLSIFSNNGDFHKYISSSPNSYDNAPMWSPSGDLLAFNSTEVPGGYADGPCGGGAEPAGRIGDIPFQVIIFSLSTNSRTTIAEGEIKGWSPDSSTALIVFSEWIETSREKEGGIWRVYGETIYELNLVNIETNETTFLVNGLEAAWQPTKIPTPIKDLRIWPGNYSQEFVLFWTMPEEQGFPIKNVDIRFLDQPITTKNWIDSRILYQGEIPNLNDLIQELSVRNPEIQPNKKWFFSIKIKGEEGWSQLSNTPILIDSGFRHEPDGYQFSNLFNTADYIFTIDQLEKMFNRDEVCKPSISTECKPTIKGELFLKDVNYSLKNGVCFGMASASQNFFFNPTVIDEIFHNFEVVNVYSTLKHEVPEVRSNIAYYQATSKARDFLEEKSHQIKEIDSNEIHKQLENFLLGINEDPVILIFEDPNVSDIAHAVVPIALTNTELNGELWYLHFYDNNLTKDQMNTRIFEFNLYLNEWHSINWDPSERITSVGKFSSPQSKMVLIPLSLIYQEKQELPYFNWKDFLRIWSATPLELTITDEFDHVIFYKDNKFIIKIPDSFIFPEIGSNNRIGSPVFYLPSSVAYNISMIFKSDHEVFFNYYLNNRLISIYAYPNQNIEEVEFFIKSDNNNLSISSNIPINISLSWSRFEVIETQSINFIDVTLLPNNTLEIKEDEKLELLSISHTGLSKLNYGLNINLYNSLTDDYYNLINQSLGINETHSLNLRDWPEKNSILLEIDENSDGIIEKTKKIRKTHSFIDDIGSTFIGIGFLCFGIVMITGSISGIFLYRRKSKKSLNFS